MGCVCWIRWKWQADQHPTEVCTRCRGHIVLHQSRHPMSQSSRGTPVQLHLSRHASRKNGGYDLPQSNGVDELHQEKPRVRQAVLATDLFKKQVSVSSTNSLDTEMKICAVAGTFRYHAVAPMSPFHPGTWNTAVIQYLCMMFSVCPGLHCTLVPLAVHYIRIWHCVDPWLTQWDQWWSDNLRTYTWVYVSQATYLLGNFKYFPWIISCTAPSAPWYAMHTQYAFALTYIYTSCPSWNVYVLGRNRYHLVIGFEWWLLQWQT